MMIMTTMMTTMAKTTTRRRQHRAGALLLGLTLTLTAVSANAAQQQPAGARVHAADAGSPQPITTGSPAEKMDAGESNAEMEAYRHSRAVQALARLFHVPVERAAQLFEDVNSGLLILVIAYFLIKFLPPAFRARRQKISRELADARSATELANRRLQAVEARLAALDAEIEAMRRHAADESAGEQRRIEASLEAERARIIRSAEQEIGAAQAAAQRELKRLAAELAVDRAMSRIELSAEADRILVSEFTEELGSALHRGDFPTRGQN